MAGDNQFDPDVRAEIDARVAEIQDALPPGWEFRIVEESPSHVTYETRPSKIAKWRKHVVESAGTKRSGCGLLAAGSLVGLLIGGIYGFQTAPVRRPNADPDSIERAVEQVAGAVIGGFVGALIGLMLVAMLVAIFPRVEYAITTNRRSRQENERSSGVDGDTCSQGGG